MVVAILFLAGLMVLQLLVASIPAMQALGWHFLVGMDWDPVHEHFGALPFIYGTLASSLLALILAAPLGIGVAIFLAELAPPWFRAPVSFMVELLAAIPSVVYGVWGLFVMAPWLRNMVQPWLSEHLGFLPFFQGPGFGVGILAAGLILAIMVVPTITAVSRDVLMAVPNHQREAMLALGATKWETTWKAVIPYGRSGIVGAIILALGRALGETMAATMVIGNSLDISISLFAPANTMASIIANSYAEATYGLHAAALIEIALILFVITLILNIVARLLVRRVAIGPVRMEA
ncbi:MAG: phosphate ABC transporter permease subunit PstC [Clostridia bacterium]|nr:MAG: phosphate ABC transporter permease subunit PstC [Clostridia bacterium]